MTPPLHLPQPVTSFVGRSVEVRTVAELLVEHRLVTVAGPGGAGKTRLALEVAAERAASGDDAEVRWLELAGLTDGSAVADAAAQQVGALVDPGGDPVASLVAHLAVGRTVLCMDNAEHLLAAVAELAEALLAACPGVTLLVTSREPLGVAGEVVWRVPPMVDEEAAGLFVQRAGAVRPGYRPDGGDSAVIDRIVRHLDGVPLALELAAAWMGIMSPRQILAGLDDRFRLLVRGPRNATRRQQTLAGSIGWSHALLGDVDRALLRRLSVFAGSFPLQAALAVGTAEPLAEDEALASLGRLVDKSLVMADHGAGETRYRLLETIRAFARARLVSAGEEEATRDRHLQWYAQFLEQTPVEHDQDMDRWLASVRPEYTDLRAALDWGLRRPDHEPVRGLAASLAWLWHFDRHGHEGIDYLRSAIALAPDDRSEVQARLLMGLALVSDTTAPLDLEYDAATAALEIATELGDDRLRGMCLNLAAVGAAYTDFDRAQALAEQAVEAAPDVEFLRAATGALHAILLHHRDRHHEADAAFDAVIPALVRLHRGIASTATSFQAIGALVTGDPGRALRLAKEALALAEPLGDYLRVGIARSALAVVHAAAGRVDEATAALEPLLRLVDAASDDVFVAGLPLALGAVAVARGEPAAAARWFRRDAAATDGGVDSWIAASALAELGTVLVSLGELPEAAGVLDRAVAAATRLNMPRVLATARAAQAELAAGNPDTLTRAADLDHDALKLRAEHNLRSALPGTLESLARHGAAVHPSPDDVRILAAADAARAALGSPRAPDQQATWTTCAARLRADLGDAEYDTAWAEGERLDLDGAIAFARRMRGTRGRPSSGWESLTPTELDVTALVAQGLNNPQIAARLLMGRGTVKTHLSHIFAKLGIANRAELASLASGRSGHRAHTGT